MAINSVLFFNQIRNYGVGSLTFDLVLSESHNRNNAISEYNIENGSFISDHIQNQLETGSVSGVISNFSINSTGIVSNRAQDAFDLLEELWKAKQLVTITTVHKVYENVAIESINVGRDDATGEAIYIDISFKKVNIVSLKEVTVVATLNIADTLNDINKQSSPNVDLGKTTGVIR